MSGDGLRHSERFSKEKVSYLRKDLGPVRIPEMELRPGCPGGPGQGSKNRKKTLALGGTTQVSGK